MKPQNSDDFRKGWWQFILVFSIMIAMMFSVGFFTIKTGIAGVGVMEKRYTHYSEMFRKKAALTYKIDEILKLLNQANTKKRTRSQFKGLENMLSKACDDILESIGKEANENNFTVYVEMVNIIKDIQTELEISRGHSEQYDDLENRLKICTEKYNEAQIAKQIK